MGSAPDCSALGQQAIAALPAPRATGSVWSGHENAARERTPVRHWRRSALGLIEAGSGAAEVPARRCSISAAAATLPKRVLPLRPQATRLRFSCFKEPTERSGWLRWKFVLTASTHEELVRVLRVCFSPLRHNIRKLRGRDALRDGRVHQAVPCGSICDWPTSYRLQRAACAHRRVYEKLSSSR